jgi:hypothetical protein
LIRNEKPVVLGEKNCHTTVKSEAFAPSREMPVIPVNKMAEGERIIG